MQVWGPGLQSLRGVSLRMMSHNSNQPSHSAARIAPRYQFEARIAIRIQAGDQVTLTGGWARDLSESGLGAFVAQKLSLGELVTLVIPLTKSVKLVVPAQVVVSMGTRYGFRFTALSPEQRALIRSAVQHQPEVPGSFPPTK